MTGHVPFPTFKEVDASVDAIMAHARDQYDVELTDADRYLMQTRLMQIGEHAPLLILTLAAHAQNSQSKPGHQAKTPAGKAGADIRYVLAFTLIGGALAYGMLQPNEYMAIPASIFIAAIGIIHAIRSWRAERGKKNHTSGERE